MTFELDLAGGAEVLKELSAEVITALGHQVGDGAGEDAKVKTYVTDRFAAAVTVPAELQAKDGVLTRAAAAAGLEVKPRKERPRKRSGRPRKKKGVADAAADDT